MINADKHVLRGAGRTTRLWVLDGG